VAVEWVTRRAGLNEVSDRTDVGLKQALTAAVVVAVLVGPFVSPAAGSFGLETGAVTAETGPDDVADRQGSLAWLRANTPPEGTYGRPDSAPLARYPTVRPTDDYDYPPGTYGVVAWWDSGHYLTTLGRRIPVANPFQDGREAAADFFLERSETAATDRVTWGDERARYVVVEWSLAVPSLGRYASPIQFTNATDRLADLVRPVYLSRSHDRQFAGYVKRQAHYESLRVRLFRYHGSAQAPRPVVTDWRDETVRSGSGRRVRRAVVGPETAFVRRFDTLAEAREFAREDGSAQVGGVDGIPAARVPALEHYRLVHASASEYDTDTLSGGERGPRVKTFERVPGATVRGRAPPNATVSASVRLTMRENESFTYTQRARTGPDGTFEMTLPYSSTGYDEWGVEAGYTNVSVRATERYTFTAQRPGETGPLATQAVHVPEGRVVGAETRPVNVTLTGSADRGT
jgi:dolichyl-diphosphooligosaccharide--protein glycosyltransferase